MSEIGGPIDDGGIAAKDDPLALFQAWMEEAKKTEPNEANAMAIATADARGNPNVRMVLLKEATPAGFVFYTNTQSAKGNELTANPRIAILFHWKTQRRQIRIRGPVARVSDAEADAYFASRAKDSQIGAWASQQSRPM
ncbi:MAG TPA: pyridoxal 5'-phosphate synthase, partial [Rhizomicrobium sp.]|nr:pyridoxal 5'-phosphate synthase [Rhizomicrobium sp.]